MPIVEPEVLMDGEHTIERCEEVTRERTLNAGVYDALPYLDRVMLEGTVLKPNMVTSGARTCPQQAGVDEVAERTVRTLETPRFRGRWPASRSSRAGRATRSRPHTCTR